MDLPEFCFCGCGAYRNKFDTANLDGVMVVLELGKWVNYLNVMTRAETPPEHLAQTENFMADGATAYKWVHAEVHDGVKRDRKQRKMTKRWTKFSRKAREDASAHAASLGIPDPLELPLVGPDDLRAWVYEGTLPLIETDPDAP